jgi:hypothetical protein
MRIESEAGNRIRFGALDWLIAVLVPAFVLMFPGLLPNLLDHL